MTQIKELTNLLDLIESGIQKLEVITFFEIDSSDITDDELTCLYERLNRLEKVLYKAKRNLYDVDADLDYMRFSNDGRLENDTDLKESENDKHKH